VPCRLHHAIVGTIDRDAGHGDRRLRRQASLGEFEARIAGHQAEAVSIGVNHCVHEVPSAATPSSIVGRERPVGSDPDGGAAAPLICEGKWTATKRPVATSHNRSTDGHGRQLPGELKIIGGILEVPVMQ
jgi:hypothetical protein